MNKENKNKFIKDEKNGIEYELVGEYYIPLLVTKDSKNIHLEKYGIMKLNYLKKYKRATYETLLMQDELDNYLQNIDKVATKREKIIIKNLAGSANIPLHYDGKMNQLEWIKLMNNFKNSAEEIIKNELIFS